MTTLAPITPAVPTTSAPANIAPNKRQYAFLLVIDMLTGGLLNYLPRLRERIIAMLPWELVVWSWMLVDGNGLPMSERVALAAFITLLHVGVAGYMREAYPRRS